MVYKIHVKTSSHRVISSMLLVHRYSRKVAGYIYRVLQFAGYFKEAPVMCLRVSYLYTCICVCHIVYM